MIEGFHNCFTDSNDHLIARNYDKLVRALPFRTKVNYTNMAKVFHSQIPANFFEKFPEIMSVSISELVDKTSDMFDFLEQCGNLQCLQMKNCRYDQQFFLDLLRFQSLWQLIVEEPTGQIDFQFILQFEHLVAFELYSDGMPVELAYEFLKKRGRSFVFKKLNSHIKIEIFHSQRRNSYNWLLIDDKNVSSEIATATFRKTMDKFFSYLKKHEHRKFFV